MFGSALACGMLMGVLSGGIKKLLSSTFLSNLRLNSLEEVVIFNLVTLWVGASLLLMSAAVYRRSTRTAAKALMCALLGAIIHCGSEWLINDAMFKNARFLGPAWGRVASYFAWTLVPNILDLLIYGVAAAALYGFPKQRLRFLASGAIAFGVIVAQSTLLGRYISSINVQEANVITTMLSLISGLIWGVALAWPVERLDREAAVL